MVDQELLRKVCENRSSTDEARRLIDQVYQLESKLETALEHVEMLSTALDNEKAQRIAAGSRLEEYEKRAELHMQRCAADLETIARQQRERDEALGRLGSVAEVIERYRNTDMGLLTFISEVIDAYDQVGVVEKQPMTLCATCGGKKLVTCDGFVRACPECQNSAVERQSLK